MTTVLQTHSLSAGYHGHPLVHDLDIEVKAGEVVALLGPNGAGKTTTLLTLAGELKPLGGQIVVHGDAKLLPVHRRARRGMAFVTEERTVFTQLSVAENLRVGGCDVDSVLALFPELRPMLRRRAGLISGGEQQMLTLGRALGRAPRLLLADELSLGLAPMLVTRLLQAVRAAADSGVAVLLVEQHVSKALQIADRVYVMRRGRITLEGRSAEVAAQVEAAYLGGNSDEADGQPVAAGEPR